MEKQQPMIFHFTETPKSVFHYKKIDKDDLLLCRSYGLRDWNDKERSDCIILRYSYWTISRDKSMLLYAMGGSSVEGSEKFCFVWRGYQFRIEFGGEKERSVSCRENDNGQLTIERKLSVSFPWNASPGLTRADVKKEIYAHMAEAFVVQYSKNGQIPFYEYISHIG